MTKYSRRDFLSFGAGCVFASGLFTLPSLAESKIRRSFAEKRGRGHGDDFADGEPAKIQPGSFTVAVLPDTQNYSEFFPDNYFAQTQWLADNRESRNIACVLHLGDITNKNTPKEWEVAQKAMQILDGKVPYVLATGNHDYGECGGATNRDTLFNNYFPVSNYSNLPTFGGTYDREPDRMDNSYHTFSAGGRQLLVLSLEFAPRVDVVRWANEVVAKHPAHEAILVTHAYLYHNNQRYDWKQLGAKQDWNPHTYGVAAGPETVMDGEQLWNELVSKHDNFIMTLNGHVLGDGLGRLKSKSEFGNDVHQMLVNYQMHQKGGEGWMRLMEFCPDGQTVKVCDYSPIRNQRNESCHTLFTLKLLRGDKQGTLVG